jgi:hypothetical protein
MSVIPCQSCGQMLPVNWNWFVCTTCGFRICPTCLGLHTGPYGSGYKCSRCPFGQMNGR